MYANDYQNLAGRTINEELTKKEIELHALSGMVGEIGEIHSVYQKHFQGHEFNKEEIKKEVGDLLWFIAEYCTIMGWSLGEVMDLNIEKLLGRHPDGFEKERSVNREE